MGKWSHLIGQFPERKEASETLKKKYADFTTDKLEQELAEMYDKKKRLEKEHNLSKLEYEAMAEVLLERWAENKTTGRRREGIGLLSRSDEVYARIKDLNTFKDWSKEQGLDNLVQETVNAKSLSSTVKQLLADGEEIPEGVSVFTKSTVKVTKPKQKGAAT